MKREGSYVSDALYSELLYDRKLAPSLGLNLLRQDEEVPEILTRLKEEPQAVVKQLEALREHRTLTVLGRMPRRADPMCSDRPIDNAHQCRW